MGKVLYELTARETEFIASQKVFFVATAPLSPHHHVSVSPKSPGTSVVVLGPKKVAYADLAGSGAETAAHVSQNGRITLLFVNLESGPPKILRLHGKAKVIPADDLDEDFLRRFPAEITQKPGFRSVFVVTVERISTSCGYSMPVMDFCRYRSTLDDFYHNMGRDEVRKYIIKKNSYSIDGLPSVAQMSQNSPNVLPYSDEGFVFGRIVGDASRDTETRHNNLYKTSISRIVSEVTARANGWFSTSEIHPWTRFRFGFGIGVGVGIGIASCLARRNCQR